MWGKFLTFTGMGNEGSSETTSTSSTLSSTSSTSEIQIEPQRHQQQRAPEPILGESIQQQKPHYPSIQQHYVQQEQKQQLQHEQHQHKQQSTEHQQENIQQYPGILQQLSQQPCPQFSQTSENVEHVHPNQETPQSLQQRSVATSSSAHRLLPAQTVLHGTSSGSSSRSVSPAPPSSRPGATTPSHHAPFRRTSTGSTQSSLMVEAPELDLSHLSAEERAQITTVMARAAQMQSEIEQEDRMRLVKLFNQINIRITKRENKYMLIDKRYFLFII